RRGAHSEDAVLAVQQYLAILRQEVGDECRQTNTEVDHHALGEVSRHASSHLFTGATLDAHGSAVRARAGDRATRTRRCTKMPGVTTVSGSSPPSSTTSLTWTMVHLAAAAMIGPKFRAVLRYTR